MKLASFPVLAAALALAVSPVAAKRRNPDPTMRILGDLHVAAGCDDPASPQRVWCIAADGWATGTPGKLPMGKVLIGVTINRTVDATGPWDLNADPTIGLAALAVRHDGAANELRLTDVTPSDDDEKLMLLQTVGNVAAVLKNRQKLVKVPKDLATYLRSLGKKSGHFATKGATGWTWTGESAGELRKVGKFWVVIETPKTGADGRFITILTEKWK
jgi:hypothetical protein